MAGVQQGSNADMVIERPCIKPDKFEGELAECGCLVKAAAPEPPSLPYLSTEENKGRLKQFLVDMYMASFSTCQHQPLPMMHGHHWNSLWRRMPDLMQSWHWACWRMWGKILQ